MKRHVHILIGIFILSSCSPKLKEHQFPSPVDTTDKLIDIQEKGTFRINKTLSIDNEFDGARFNSLVINNDSSIAITTTPENEPINSSPWYAFRLITDGTSQNSSVTININYPEKHKHRYWPNISTNNQISWERLDSTFFKLSPDSLQAIIKLDLLSDTTWISAQPLISSSDVRNWCSKLSKQNRVQFASAGESIKGRSLPFLKIGNGSKVIAIFSRQHPPEVTGFKALQYFIDEILTNQMSDDFLNEYSLLVYPLLNPDGVDMGHWRHNAVGVDLNRDWAFYRQPETKAVANHIVNTLNEENLEMELGLDFHSTWYDIYYTTDRSLKTKNHSFTDDWFKYIESNLEGYKVKDAPSGLRSPVSKGWFVSQFNVPGITYEIGDNTPDEFNKEKSRVAAKGLMKILIE